MADAFLRLSTRDRRDALGVAGLRALAKACGDRFAFGVVLYDSIDFVPFGDRLAAAPLSCLWGQVP